MNYPYATLRRMKRQSLTRGRSQHLGFEGMRGPTPPKIKSTQKKPEGWNAKVALERAEKRQQKLADRKATRAHRQLAPQMELGQPIQIRNRRTGKPHEHARAKARRLRQVGAA